MAEESWSLDQVFDGLAGVFDRETLDQYRKLADDPTAAFHRARTHFSDEVSRSNPYNDINDDFGKKRLILGHILLAIFSSLAKGEKRFLPLPSFEDLSWSKKENALLLWSARHGSSDIRGLPGAPGTPTREATPQER